MSKPYLWNIKIFLTFISLVLSSCTTIPKSLKGHSATPQQDLKRIMSAPKLFIGQESRFGGKVIKVDNLIDKTRLEIATIPLDIGARPIIGHSSIGRIFADVNGFIDPINFNNQMVTIIGKIKGTEKNKIGDAEYTFLVIQVTGYQLWQITHQIIMPLHHQINPCIWSSYYDHYRDHYRIGVYNPYIEKGISPCNFYKNIPLQFHIILTKKT